MFLSFNRGLFFKLGLIALNSGCVFFIQSRAYAATFSSIYQMALQQDPSVAGAYLQISAAQERANQAQGALDSKLSFSGEEKFGEQKQRHDGQSDVDSTTRQYALQYSYPLYRPTATVNLEQSRILVKLAHDQNSDISNGLLGKVTNLFFDILIGRAELKLLETQMKAVKEQKQLAKLSFDLGSVSITDLREAEAKYSNLAVQEQTTQLELYNKQELLKQIAGNKAIVDDYQLVEMVLPPINQNDLSSWLAKLDNNPKIQQALKNIEISQLEVEKSQAARYPTFDFNTSMQRNLITQKSDNINRQNGWSNQIGFSINIPLYNNETRHKIRETKVLLEKAQYDLTATRLNENSELRQAFFAVIAESTRYRGLIDAENSALIALKANQKAYQVGMRINAEVLDAQSKLYEVKRDRLKAWYNAWSYYIKLKSLVGQPQPKDLEEVDHSLNLPRKN